MAEDPLDSLTEERETRLHSGNLGKLVVRPIREIPVTFNMLIYGDPGVGKTRLAGSSAAVDEMCPVLFVDIEGGTLSIRREYPGIDVVRCKDMYDIQEVYKALASGDSGYRTVVIDSLTELQKFSMNHIMRQVVAEDEERDPDIPSLREWGKNLEQLRRFVRAFRDLPLNTIFTALAVEDKNQKTGQVTIRPGLSGKAANEVAGFLDIVLHMYVKEADDELIRLLLTQKTSRVIAKDRTDNLPQVMTDVTMRDIYDVAFNSKKQATEGDNNGSA